MYSTLLFDLDGTLIDSAADIAASVNHTRTHFGQAPLPLDAVKAAVGDGLPTLLERTVAAPADAAKQVYWQHHEQHCLDATAVYPGVREGLEALRGRVRLGVVTNKPQAFATRILAGLGLADRFGCVVGGDTPAGKKPAPGPLLAALQQLYAGPWDALYVGDSANDVAAARAAGTAACAIGWGFRPLETIRAAGPDHEAQDFAQLVAFCAGPASVHAALGSETFWTLARAFYARVDRDPRLRAMFPPLLDQAIEHQATFFIQFFGGPQDYSKQRGHPRLRMRHAPFRIDQAARDAWYENMLQAMAEVGIPEPAAGIMRRYFAHTATFLINAAS